MTTRYFELTNVDKVRLQDWLTETGIYERIEYHWDQSLFGFNHLDDELAFILRFGPKVINTILRNSTEITSETFNNIPEIHRDGLNYDSKSIN